MGPPGRHKNDPDLGYWQQTGDGLPTGEEMTKKWRRNGKADEREKEARIFLIKQYNLKCCYSLQDVLKTVHAWLEYVPENRSPDYDELSRWKDFSKVSVIVLFYFSIWQEAHQMKLAIITAHTSFSRHTHLGKNPRGTHANLC